jgi:hypothetical protein
LVSFYQTPSVGWVLSPCPESCMHIQKLQIRVSIVRCNVVCRFLSWHPLPHASAVGGVQGGLPLQLLELSSLLLWFPGRPFFAASTWCVFSLTLGHHIVAA